MLCTEKKEKNVAKDQIHSSDDDNHEYKQEQESNGSRDVKREEKMFDKPYVVEFS